jgi:hypothetical protein
MEFFNTNENAIEFLRNRETMTCTFSQPRFINRVRKLKERYPDEVDIMENSDGTVVAHMPVSWLHIANYHHMLTPEQREQLSERGKRLAMEQKARRESQGR